MSEDDWHAKYTSLSHAFEARTDELVAEIKEKDAKYDTMNKMYNTLLHNHDKLIDWVLENQREEIIALLLRDAA